MRPFHRKNRWKDVDFALLIPVRTVSAVDGDRPDQVVLLQPRYRGGLLGRFLQPRLPDHKKYLRVALEDRGSFLWGLLDGRRTVGELAAAFVARFPEDADRAPERVAGYLYNLEQNGFLCFRNLENG